MTQKVQVAFGLAFIQLINVVSLLVNIHIFGRPNMHQDSTMHCIRSLAAGVAIFCTASSHGTEDEQTNIE